MKVFPLFILPTLVRSLNEPKLCVNCVFFKNELFNSNTYGKCTAFPIQNENNDHLIDGRFTKEVTTYYYCSTSRKSSTLCGEEGRRFIAKSNPTKWF